MNSFQEMLTKLRTKFGENLDATIIMLPETLERIEIKGRAFTEIAEMLVKHQETTGHRKQVAQVFDELFADLVVSVYLGALSLEKPAEMVLRRVLELGVGVVYLWDLPHIFWGWKDHDMDLNFNDMLDHLNATNFKAFLHKELGIDPLSPLLDQKSAKEIYRTLSNTVHGKVSTFESSIPDCYSPSKEDWERHLSRVESVENILINLWIKRFPFISEELARQSSPLLRITSIGVSAIG